MAKKTSKKELPLYHPHHEYHPRSISITKKISICYTLYHQISYQCLADMQTNDKSRCMFTFEDLDPALQEWKFLGS